MLPQAKPGLRRVRSWAGEVRADNSSACHDQRAVRARHLHRLSASSASLPPLAVLPPPISMGVPPPANIDLDVNFEAEIKPHLHACLVSPCCQQQAIFGQHVVGLPHTVDLVTNMTYWNHWKMPCIQCRKAAESCKCRGKEALAACLRHSGVASQLLSRYTPLACTINARCRARPCRGACLQGSLPVSEA